ncbi:hypothetical protein FRC12_012213, partial [Ceratobasidium sp. 428]
MTLIAQPVDGVYRITIPTKDSPCMQISDDGKVSVVPRDTNQNSQKWNVVRLPEKQYHTYRITSLNNKYTLTWNANHELLGEASSKSLWTVEIWAPGMPRLIADRQGDRWVEAMGDKTIKIMPSNSTRVMQHWVFEPVEPEAGTAPTFEDKFFTLTVEQAAQQDPGKEYDIVIVGSGIGGGVLAHDLFDTNRMLGKHAKRVLLLEKGGLVFHSHCLNTARPDGLVNDRGQQNGTFFRLFREDFVFDPPLTSKDWNGGPIFALGGRSSAWGL